MRRTLILVVVLGLLAAIGVSADTAVLVTNGGLEGPAQGGVASGWAASNSGNWAHFEYADGAVVAEGLRSQALIIDTRGLPGSHRDTYSWLTQPVKTIQGSTYRVSLQALIQTTPGDSKASDYGYRLEVGLSDNGLPFVWDVTEWVELSATEHPLDGPASLAQYEATLVPKGKRSALFIRAWKKFATVGERAVFTVDDVRLEPADTAASTSGPVSAAEQTTVTATASPTTTASAASGSAATATVSATPSRTPTVAPMLRPLLPATGASSGLLYTGVVLAVIILAIACWRLSRLSR